MGKVSLKFFGILGFAFWFASPVFADRCSEALFEVLKTSNLERIHHYTNRMLSLRSQKPRERFLAPHIVTDTNRIVRGVPPQLRELPKANRPVFRHFTTAGVVQKLLEEPILKSGIRSLLVGGDAHWIDVTGVFLTATSAVAQNVLDADQSVSHAAYVDIEIPEEIPVLALDLGKNFQPVYLVAGPPFRPDWLRRDYEKFANGESLPSTLTDMFREIQQRDGSLLPPIEVPVKIVAYSLDGKLSSNPNNDREVERDLGNRRDELSTHHSPSQDQSAPSPWMSHWTR